MATETLAELSAPPVWTEDGIELIAREDEFRLTIDDALDIINLLKQHAPSASSVADGWQERARSSTWGRGYVFGPDVGLVEPAAQKQSEEEGEAKSPKPTAAEKEKAKQRRVYDARTQRLVGGVSLRGRINTVTSRTFDGMPRLSHGRNARGRSRYEMRY